MYNNEQDVWLYKFSCLDLERMGWKNQWCVAKNMFTYISIKHSTHPSGGNLDQTFFGVEYLNTIIKKCLHI
jgi:hypothetical protein